jgi:hypothetical protein
MEKHQLWKKIEEARLAGQSDVTMDDNGAEITIHVNETTWYPEYY